jgi:hypothetical protein
MAMAVQRSKGATLSRTARKRKRNEENGRDIQFESIFTSSPDAVSYLSISTRILHRVDCKKKGHHAEHPGIAHYVDVPRLFRGDSKASFLRGKAAILNTEVYLEMERTISIVLYKIYSCDDYHEAIEDQFEKLPTPDNPDLTNVTAYFYRLNDDGEEATAMREDMSLISEDLKAALSELTGKGLDYIQALNGEASLAYVYNLLYHYRQPDHPDILALNYNHQQQIGLLQQFMDSTYGADYKEADELFSRHRISYGHLAKLFGPNQIVVEKQNQHGQPQAYMLSDVSHSDAGSLPLTCWSWSFDGQFWREPALFTVDWPFLIDEEVFIDQLNVYPLRFDRSGLYDRLLKRGLQFWDCRNGKYILYTAPASGIKTQAVCFYNS